MGTPEIACTCLEGLVNSEHEVLAVLTQSDKPVGRKKLLTSPPVKLYALSKNILTFQPEKLKNNINIFNNLKDLNPDVIIVVAYGKILPKEILNIPKFGCINLHASLLPKYRGAAPVQWAIINGEKNTGLTTMFMDKGLDTGDILLQEEINININENSEELLKRLAPLGAELIKKTLYKLENNQIFKIKQDNKKASFAPMLTKELSLINFQEKTAYEIHNLIRGLNPWPCAYIIFQEKKLKIYKTEIFEDFKSSPGEIIKINPLIISCKNNTSLKLLEVQHEGKNRISGEEFARGKRLIPGQLLQ